MNNQLPLFLHVNVVGDFREALIIAALFCLVTGILSSVFHIIYIAVLLTDQLDSANHIAVLLEVPNA